MRLSLHAALAIILSFVGAIHSGRCDDQPAVRLPNGVVAVWDIDKAWHETTPTRQRISINGLWQWQPAEASADRPPRENWGYYKVPGCWPGNLHYMMADSQTLYRHPSWKRTRRDETLSAWYQREISVPKDWKGRRIAVTMDCVNSYAAVYIDDKKAGEIQFPAGEVDLTSLCVPGSKHTLSVLVVAMPLQEVMLKFGNTNAPKREKSTVARRGLCGDVYLVSTPAGARIADVMVETSVRKGEIAFNAGLLGLDSDTRYTLRAVITDHGRTVEQFTSKPFGAGDLTDGRIVVTDKWKAEKLWDLNTPQNMYDLTVSLLGADGKALDTDYRDRFGFRELWIEGRDFYLNGTRIYLSAVPLDNGQVGAGQATYESAKESMLRLKTFGINFVYSHTFDCQPGTHISYAEIVRAADDVGMLFALSQPHFGQYNWRGADAEKKNGYARHAEYYVHVAQNHPSVVFYCMSHNSVGYREDMNPDMIDGIIDGRGEGWSKNNAKLARRAEAIVTRLDPARIVYHHAGGNIGAVYTSNFYPNWVPIQELSDWFEHWATKGVKPFFACEYGAPFPWDWTMYRGWYKGKEEFGGAIVPWEFCLAEWNSQFLGDRAFQISEQEKANLRHEAELFRTRDGWTRYDYPYNLGSKELRERYPIYAMYLVDNWRAFRTWGMSANSPWDFSAFWTLRKGVARGRKNIKVDWEHLQRPGFSPDYISSRAGSMELGYERSDWIPTVAAQALIRNNQPLLAYIGGKRAAFTSKDHNFLPGETAEKQIIVINNSRETVTCKCHWTCDLPNHAAEDASVTMPTGQQERLPVRISIPAATPPGPYTIHMTAKFSGGEVQEDTFTIDVLPQPPEQKAAARIALFDPKGETSQLLDRMNVKYRRVDAGADLTGYDLLVVGKAALTAAGAGPDITRVRQGMKVLVFEQTSDVLEKRFGFRVNEYGLRTVFSRVPDHPALAGLGQENLRDWRGSATILPSHLDYQLRAKPFDGMPTVDWCGIPVTRLWRCGNRGNVASVLIEKPARGDFLPIIDGGFSLQYSPLMEYREGQGVVLFCQMDVSGRTETDPAAERLARNVVQYISDWKPSARREALYVGDAAGRSHLEKAGISTTSYEGGAPSANQVLIVGPGGGQKLSANATDIQKWLGAGGCLLAIGLGQKDLMAPLPSVAMKNLEHIAAYFEPQRAGSLLAGVGPADVHNRDPRVLPLVSSGATVIGDGVLAKADEANIVFCQLVPWQFDYSQQHTAKRTFRRVSFLVTRLLGNMGVEESTPLLARFRSPVDPAKPEKRWLDGLYLDQPEEWDDPYRFFRW